MGLHWYHYLAFSSLAICLSACLFHVVRLIRLGRPTDLSKQAGALTPAVLYAFTGAMSPARKESAMLHLPTYFAGIVYHMGTFLSLILFIFISMDLWPGKMLALMLAGCLFIAFICGSGILLKRIALEKIRALSHPDDYIANLLVTLFQFFSAIVLLDQQWQITYYIGFSLLMLYLPVGKLKHTVYFFAARYLLGFHYGWRGVWPPRKVKI